MRKFREVREMRRIRNRDFGRYGSRDVSQRDSSDSTKFAAATQSDSVSKDAVKSENAARGAQWAFCLYHVFFLSRAEVPNAPSRRFGGVSGGAPHGMGQTSWYQFRLHFLSIFRLFIAFFFLPAFRLGLKVDVQLVGPEGAPREN